MDTPEQPQLYLVTPPEFELSRFPDVLASALDAHEVACVRLDLATRDEDRLSRAADVLREVTHARDIALVVSDHWRLAERLGLDGVHLTDGARAVREARKALGPDAIVGSFCATSRHDGMTAGEAGADYVSFGPVRASGLGDGSFTETDLFSWWSEMIEVPVVAEGNLTAERAAELVPFTDFFGIGEEIWAEDDPAKALGALVQAMG
ncbi:thiamine phosphate synthase [Roseobacter cerasinus]|uniref:Thiamine phosphate synthase n=1 Tax=Roseobacter cerasinus TaxID=2602289 RepID=A0A640VT49_9RHOB|nr:thiamine phosphate synthase [Roseobacter cerasinus]GFE50261.1 thiamine phosphate synthase [Roseobacter cerasinus]